MHTKTYVLMFFLIFGLICSASALTVDVDKARMVLRLSPGQSSEDYLVLKNTNGVPVTAELSVSGDLASTTILKDSLFEILPDREKYVYFVVSPKNPGTFETKINVRYSTSDGQGQGVSVVLVVIATGNSTLEDNSNSMTGSSSFNFRDFISKINIELTPLNLMYFSTGLLALILIVVLLYLFNVSRKLNKLRKRK
jgi:hypothetical protein